MKLVILPFILIITLINKIKANLDDTYADIIATLKCKSENAAALSRDDTTELCLHFIIDTNSGTSSPEAKRIAYSVTVDKYVALYIDSAFNTLNEEYPVA